MTNEIVGNYGKVIFADCIESMQDLIKNNKKFDLCITDPPYNQSFKGFGGAKSIYTEDIEYYEDNKSPEEYRMWCKNWFNLLQQVSNRQVISVGNRNISMWYKDQEVYDQFIGYDPTGSFGSRIAKFNHANVWLLFGNQKPHLLPYNVVKNMHVLKHHHTLKHPCPRPIEIVEYLLSHLKPTSVIDIFAGSGTTAEACESLKIEYTCIEINEQYRSDIESRINAGIKRAKIKHNKLLRC